MDPLLTIRSLLAIPLLLALLWVVLLHPRRQHPGLENLRKYRYAHRGYHAKPQIPENSMYHTQQLFAIAFIIS